jgi:hypothetical protein
MIAASHLLDIEYRTLFVVTENGKIERENDPDHSPGPRFWLARCRSGNVFGVHVDVSDDIVIEIASLAASEPPFIDSTGPPKYADRYVELLAQHDPVPPRKTYGLIYRMPNSFHYGSRALLVGSDSDEGRRLREALLAKGIPECWVELGFNNVTDLWPPWCAAIIDGKIASIAFTARLSQVGAEIGVATAKAFRGQGFASAAASGWSRLPTLCSRALFYSTDQANISSQRVAARLGLRLLGASLRLW